ncbi:C-type lectin domain family 4 member F-like [Chanodichthys erythropterus]|uniref:C-type lectin domain family 4 member F-like n=1 Tax=Chanodichthys erythropterus TaxID=933992 RepID=UPI00351E9096
MDLMYENPGVILSTVASDENCSQFKGNSTKKQEADQEVCPSKCTKVLLIILSVSLVLAIGGLCVLGILYINVSMQLSAQETTSTIMTAELTDNYTRVREQLSFYKAFTAQSLNCEMILTAWGGTLYFFSSHKLNWSSSRAFCVSKGADLVIITSQSEQMFLISKIKESHWIGLNDLDTEGRWVWVNNQTLTETGVQ